MTGYFCSHNSGFITWLCRHLANRRCFPPPKGHRVAGTITTADDPLARENLTGHGAGFPTARPARRETDAPSLPLMPCHPVSRRQLSCRVVAGHTNLPWRLGLEAGMFRMGSSSLPPPPRAAPPSTSGPGSASTWTVPSPSSAPPTATSSSPPVRLGSPLPSLPMSATLWDARRCRHTAPLWVCLA